jgi:hypothetical protein
VHLDLSHQSDFNNKLSSFVSAGSLVYSARYTGQAFTDNKAEGDQQHTPTGCFRPSGRRQRIMGGDVMGGRTFDQFISRQRARAQDRHEPKNPSPNLREDEQEKLPGRQPLPAKK